jgi:ParB-like chromosome segregation protein Spo0J
MSKIVTQLRDAEGVSRANSYNIDPRSIVVETGFNHRDYTLQANLDHVAEIKESIRQHGVQNPLWVRLDAGKVILVAGECRLRAVMELIEEGVPINGVPCIQKTGTPEKILLMSLTENTGKVPSQWEIGVGFQRLINFGWTPEQIAKEMGQKESWVKTALELADADKDTKNLLDQAAVTPSAVVYAIRHHGTGASLKLKAQVAEAKERAAAKPAKKKSKTPAKPAPVKREKKSNGVFVPTKTLNTLLQLFKSINEITLMAPEAYEMCETGIKLMEPLTKKGDTV